ncbi:DUF317 domain-containing protein [Streptomyces sp. NPDC048417]|uniref:DUF317 domain-containing protein n=1 Tax=Streptomyces sp. NPDC048417 TaxID=3155387 RepID=UPI003444A30D
MPPHDDTLDGDAYVFPRHLALATLNGDPALDPLLRLDWPPTYDGRGNLYLGAPDGSVRLGYLSEGPDDGLWRINAYEDPFGLPAWGVCFNDRCPTEFVTAFTTALAAAYEQGPDAYLATPVHDRVDSDFFRAFVPLLQRGWRIDHPRWGVFAVESRDGLGVVEYTTGALNPAAELTTREARWHLWAGASPEHPLWYATASTDTPTALIRAVTESLSDPAPLPRWRQETHTYADGLAQLTPILPTGPSIPTPLDVRRIASHRPAALPAASVPRWSTTSQPALPGPRR